MPIAIIYFFFNSFLLPSGLLYTSVLTPLLLVWLYQQNHLKNITVFFIVTIPFAIIHFMNGVNTRYYLISYTLLLTAYIFSLCFVEFVMKCNTLRQIFRFIIILNFFLLVIACVAFFIPSLKTTFWLVTFVSSGLDQFPRLKLLTYEPSYYSLLLLPIVMYYSLKLILFDFPNPWLVGFLIGFPLLLAFSLGILIGIPLALFILFLLKMKFFLTRKSLRQYIFLATFAITLVIVLLLIFYPDNPLFTRINNLFIGHDSSFKGRTSDSYYLASVIANKKSVLFGVGLGQIKVLGVELWTTFYNTTFLPNGIAIPNATADTFAVFGIAGVCIRIAIEIFFFFRTKVYYNYYRLALFIFIFIYQFTGSYLYNIAEFVIWILAFSNTFPEFDQKNLSASDWTRFRHASTKVSAA
ncbi:MAG: hypothetical protein ABI416_07915 [Ginsengibacter sp.]